MIMTKFRTHHPKCSEERMTIPRSLGGRGITDLAFMLDKQFFNLRNYFLDKAEFSSLHRTVVMDAGYTPPNLKLPRRLQDKTKAEHQNQQIDA